MAALKKIAIFIFCNFIKNRLQHKDFSVKFAKFLKTTFNASSGRFCDFAFGDCEWIITLVFFKIPVVLVQLFVFHKNNQKQSFADALQYRWY